MNAHGRHQLGDERGGSRARHLGEPTVRRQCEQCGGRVILEHNLFDVAAQKRAKHGVVAPPGLDDHLAAPFAPSPHQASGFGDGGERAATRGFARREQILVEVDEDDDPAVANTLPDRLSAHHHPRQRLGRVTRGGQLRDVLTQLSRHVVGEGRHPHAHAFQVRRPTGATEIGAQLVAISARELLAHFFFGHGALGATCQFTAFSTREEPTRTQALEHDRDRDRVGHLECAVGGVEGLARQDAVARVTLAPVDHAHPRPTRRDVFEALHLRAAQEQRRRGHRGRPPRCVVASTAFAHHAKGVPRRGRLAQVRLVVGVHEHRTGHSRHRGQGRTP